MPLRRWWHKRVALRALRRPVCAVGQGFATVLHARSYDAAEIGLLLRQFIKARDAGRSIVASFDMRSFLGPEIPMGHGLVGTAAYGFVKALEFELVTNSDVAFLPVNVGRRNYQDETGATIQYAPIQGLDREPGWKPDFLSRWANRRIGYSGSVGQWHDPGQGCRGRQGHRKQPARSKYCVRERTLGHLRAHWHRHVGSAGGCR